MEISFYLINGLSFGIEYVAPDEEDLPNPCIVLDVACFRWIFELTTP